MILSVVSALLIIMYTVLGMMLSAAGDRPVQEELAGKLIRFHVVGNSDSDDDQAVKMKVKEEIIQFLQPLLNEVASRGEALTILNENLPVIAALSQRTLKENGYFYGASASIGVSSFPVRKYGDIVLPAGDYEALKICLGKAEGRNWWCIMFPQLCFIDCTYSVVPDDSREKLKYLLTDEEYASIVQDKDKTEYRSFILDFFRKLLA